jgi:low affinity Fe/Cu permease
MERSPDTPPTPPVRIPRDKESGMAGAFSRFSSAAAQVAGRPVTFILACVVVVGWLVVGPIYHFSNGWQLVINTITNIVTLIMVFLLQNTQNRDARAMNLKLDELIRSIFQAHDDMIDIEKLSDKDLENIERQYEKIREIAQARRDRRQQDAA